LLETPEQLAGITWDAISFSHGFEVQTVRVSGSLELTAPLIATRTPLTLPTIPEYVAMRDAVRQAENILSGQNPDAVAARAAIERALQVNPADPKAVTLGIDAAELANDAPSEISLLAMAVEITPNDAARWGKLGDLEYRQKNYTTAEPALRHARKLGMASAAMSEELARIRLDKQDLPHAFEYLEESPSLNATQQTLWFLQADLAN
jgi:tetratricopeptide (TPR) repeat protein